MRPGLLLFDIDGTLLLSGRAGLRAMTRAFEAAFGVPNGFAGAQFAGRTDSFLVSQALTAAGLPDIAAQHHRFREAYLPLLAEEIEHPGTGDKGLMPGVPELLTALEDYEHLYPALLTGNYRDAAAIKLGHFDLWDYFEWGVFSDDAADRNLLVPLARDRAETYDVPPEAVARTVVIGDTPLDIACAHVAGALVVAVATGGHSVDELIAAGADAALPDLSDTEAVLALLI